MSLGSDLVGDNTDATDPLSSCTRPVRQFALNLRARESWLLDAIEETDTLTKVDRLHPHHGETLTWRLHLRSC